MSSLNGINKTLVVLAALFVVLGGIKLASDIVVPFILAAFIAIICNPALRFLARFKIPKGVAIVIIIALVVLIGASVGGLVGQSINDFSQQLPEYKEALQEKFVWLVNTAANYNIILDKQQVISMLDPNRLINVATNTLTSLGGVMANGFLILLIVVFMLFEAPMISDKVHLALDDPEMKMKQIDRFLESINNYLAIKTVVSLGTGLVIAVFLWALNIDYFILWGVVAFFLNYIPNIGSIIAAVPPVLLALITHGPIVSGVVVIGYVSVNTIMGNIIEPKYMGRGLGLSALVVFLSLIFWGWLLGTVGMLLSVPLTMVAKIALENSDDGKWLATLLGSQQEKIAQE
ncbi:AI-2E family transporter [Pseudoalteromonas sp. T1lg65]|uniref:AI-2E family transporter n=1 Tax=Pseudoalteromonas sp. T1lg65 TaxID=2077101 RepID=UPI003F7A9E4A